MPHPNTTVHAVELSPGSSEYQDVISKVRGTASTLINVQKIERIQNPYLYQTYMLRKQKMDRDNGGNNNERQLFHGTRGESISRINAQGFNRSFCRAQGELLCIDNNQKRRDQGLNIILPLFCKSVADPGWVLGV